MTPAVLAPALPMVRRFLALHPADAAQVLERFSAEEVADLLRALPPAVAAPLLLRVNADLGARILEAVEGTPAAQLLGALDPADVAPLLARMAESPQTALLEALPEPVRREIREILTYPPGTAGALMQTDVTRFPARTPVESALAWLRQLGGRRVTDLVVTDDEGHFAGVVPLQALVGAAPAVALGTLVAPSTISMHPLARRDEVVELIGKHRLTSIPVVDSARRVVGIIRHDSLIEAVQETAAADAQQMFGASQEEGALSPPLFGVRSRLPWLNINLLTAFLAASVVGLFESTLARFTALAVMLPVVAGQSGNTGAQALAVTMRGLALREIRPTHAFRVLRKEMVIGLLNGVAIASVTAAGTFLWNRSAGLALIMFVAMIVSMVIASLAGAAIPIVLARLGRDPAVASSIILTTVTDVVGFFSFLGLATALAGMLTDL